MSLLGVNIIPILKVSSQLMHKCKLLITSNSLNIVDCLSNNSVYVGTKLEGGNVRFQKVDNELIYKDVIEANSNAGT